MNLLEITRLLSRLDEAIDIHGLYNRYKNMPGIDLESVDGAVKDYRANIQGRKKELLKPFGLDDLDKFKDNPTGFVKMVGYAMDSFKEKKEQSALYKRVYEDDHCLITMPKGPEGAAAAGSFLKKDGAVVCPWCIAVKYPDNEKWWRHYNADAVFFVYSKGVKNRGAINNAWCVVMTAEDCDECLQGRLSYSQIESQENKGVSGKPRSQRALMKKLLENTKLDEEGLLLALKPALEFVKVDIDRKNAERSFLAVISANDKEAILEYIESGVDINCQNSFGKTPLMMAASCVEPELFALFLKKGADIFATDENGNTALTYSPYNPSTEICRMLLDRGLDRNADQIDNALATDFS